jgi:rhizosphere induced protein
MADTNQAAPIYMLRFRNRSGAEHDFACFQQKPDASHPDGATLAWFAQPAADGADVTFTWSITYDFVWMESGALTPGIHFTADEIVPGDIHTTNRIIFSKQDGAFQFSKPTDGGAPGSLTIVSDGSIPPNEATVGIGMAGSPTFVVPASPNMNYVFTPTPQYWISFGQCIPGQVLEVDDLAAAKQVIFPPSVYEMTATLDATDAWTIQQGLV